LNIEFEYVLILLALSVISILIIDRFRLSPLIGYLLVGLLISPNTTGLIPFSDTTRFLGEIGVVFLLFSIGLDFSLSRFYTMRHTVLGLGGGQVIIGTLSGFIIAWSLGMSWQAAFILGGALALSSTALVMKQLVDQFELQSEHGLTAFGILLFQDMAAVPFLVLIPILAQSQPEHLWSALILALVKGVAVLALIIVLGKTLIPRLFHIVSFSTELFTLSVLLVSLTAAWLTHAVGLSLALGAFLAGMMVSESRYRYQIENEIRPFRDILLGLFFVTVGMQLDPALIARIWPWVLLLLSGLMIGKALAIYLLMRFVNRSAHVASRTGLILGQGGEFSIALLTLAVLSGLISIEDSQPVLAAVILSMLLSPFVIRNNRLIAQTLFNEPQQSDHITDAALLDNLSETHGNHVLICGYGLVGEETARLLRDTGLTCLALDIKPAVIRKAWTDDEPVYFGNAAQGQILDSAGLGRATAVIIAVNDDDTALKILAEVRKLNTDIPVIVTTRDTGRHDIMLDSGATLVIARSREAARSTADKLMKLLEKK
jgi:CPA2 family monovalent cation:H+ antiporter-2